MRPFFAPIPSFFRERKGPVMSDSDLARAWSLVSTPRLRELCKAPKEHPEILAIRKRVLAMREAAEAETAQ